MKKLVTLEIEEALITNKSSLGDIGMIIYLDSDKYIFISGARIGIFSKASVDEVDEDFSKLDISKFDLYDLSSQISIHDEAYVTTIQ